MQIVQASPKRSKLIYGGLLEADANSITATPPYGCTKQQWIK